jgi:hypothetical protein
VRGYPCINMMGLGIQSIDSGAEFCVCSRRVSITEPAEKAQDPLEADVDAAITLCDGDVRDA